MLRVVGVALGGMVAAVAGLLVTASIFFYMIWNAEHPKPLKDLSAGALPLTFETRSPELQGKLQELYGRKLLPNQYPPPEFEAVSQRVWSFLADFMRSEGFDKLVAAADDFEELRAQEPRYSEWPDATSTQAQFDEFMKFIRFNADGVLAPLKEDAPFLKAEEFTGAISKINIPSRRPADVEAEPANLIELCKLKLFVSLAEGRRAKALRMLDLMLKLSDSPLCPDLYSETIRLEAANCAAAMLKAPGWTPRELAALRKILEREMSQAFQVQRIVPVERIASLEDFERERAEHPKKYEALSVLNDLAGYYDESGLMGFWDAAWDLYYVLTRDIDHEEFLELQLIDDLEKRGALKQEGVDSFLTSIGRKDNLSEAEKNLLNNYAATRSKADAAIRQLLGRIGEKEKAILPDAK